MSIDVKKYLVFYTPGSAGNFLGTVLQMYLTGYRGSLMSEAGDMHKSNRMNVSALHQLCKLEILKGFPGAKSIVITCDLDDVALISTMHFYKQLKPTWNNDTYRLLPVNKYPDFSAGVDNEMIKRGLLDVVADWTRLWIEQDTTLADCTISFKTVMGLNDKSLNNTVANFLNVAENKEIGYFINHYQTYNKNLYASSINN